MVWFRIVEPETFDDSSDLMSQVPASVCKSNAPEGTVKRSVQRSSTMNVIVVGAMGGMVWYY
jgi:hypothetical protein